MESGSIRDAMKKKNKTVKGSEQVWRLNAGEHEPDKQERRRAQIRHAQKAYRQRKEEAISDLAAQVEALEGIVERLNSSFLAFSDVLITSGVLEGNAVLATALADTTKTFVSLAKGDTTTPPEAESTQEDEDKSSSQSQTNPQMKVGTLSTVEENSAQFCSEQAWKDTIRREHSASVYQDTGVAAQANVWLDLAVPLEERLTPFMFEPILGYPQFDKRERSFEYRLTKMIYIRALAFLKHTHSNDEVFRRIFRKNIPPHTPATLQKRFEEGFMLLRNFGIWPLRQRHAIRIRDQAPEFTSSQIWLSPIYEAEDWLDAVQLSEYLKALGLDLDDKPDVVTLDLSKEVMASISKLKSKYVYANSRPAAIFQPTRFELIESDCPMTELLEPLLSEGGKISVNTIQLMEDLVNRSQSLGDMPGFRRPDVDRAVSMSIQILG
ncbi:hypothetical protein IQ07DRAFT_629895 [Pyrenochaeta sp. DS3sAY3a]|nr:hypothetical protein IQ07DRAFT_629895 [Pyrenochaeta sp. DS3sAY3a]